MTAILPSVVEEAERLLDQAQRIGATLALLGGIAVRLRAPEIPPSLDRLYKDIDFAVPKGRGSDADKLLRGAGYEAEIVFNAMNGKERMLFHDNQHGSTCSWARSACATRFPSATGWSRASAPSPWPNCS